MGKVLSIGLVGPLVADDQRPGDGDLGLFKNHVSSLFDRLGHFLHQVVVGRRDAACSQGLEKLDQGRILQSHLQVVTT